MPDYAVSDSPEVQRQLDRLAGLSPGADVLGLERISALLARLGNPERRLPPVFHVAGTNGKGSTCAFLRAAIEAGGLSAHVFTSPHLVRFNERIRIGGRLIGDDALASILEEVLDVAQGVEPSFFEVTTAAAILAFEHNPADACIVEVGLGGRLDATNVLPAPAVCGIAQLGLDHQSFLGPTLEAIAAEKAGIAKAGVPLVTQSYPGPIAQRIGEAAAAAGAPWFARGTAWDVVADAQGLHYRDEAGTLALPLPRLHGSHQASNAGLAIAMIRHQKAVRLPEAALRTAMASAQWPARLQRLGPGPLHDLLPAGAQLWLDGGHNPDAARAVADFVRADLSGEHPLHIVFGLLENKDARGVLKAFAERPVTLHAVPVPGHAHHAPACLAALAREEGMSETAAESVEDALGTVARQADPAHPPVVLILGSLYLAGEVLRSNGQIPT